MNLTAVWTHTLQNDSFTNPANPSFVNVFTDELADPKDQVNVSSSLKVGKFTMGYSVRWIGKQYLNTYEDYNSVNGQPAQNVDYAPLRKYPVVSYHDIRGEIEVNKQFNFYMGMDNITNRQPPYGLTGVGGGSGIYDVRGRYGYVGFVAKF